MQHTIHDDYHNETYYPEGVDPDGPHELTGWLCPKCVENGCEHGLYHNKAGFFCQCGEHYANDGELARSNTALFAKLYERIGELETDLISAERRQEDAEAKLREGRRVLA